MCGVDDVSAELLKQAAWKLRGLVADLPVAAQSTWEADGSEIRSDHGLYWVGETLHDIDDETRSLSAFIVGMQPIVALHLVEWLEAMAFLYDQTAGISPAEQRVDKAAITLAQTILREKP